MKTLFYKKVGRKYVPVREYDSDLLDSMPEGAHLIMSYPGGTSRKYCVNPTHAPFIAAFKTIGDHIARKIVDSSSLRPAPKNKEPLTTEQKIAWANFKKEMGDDAHYCQFPSAQDIVDSVFSSLTTEIDEIMANEGVKNAYEQFEFMFKLAYGEKNVK